MARITISIDDDLLMKIDQIADENGMTRSGFISLSARQYLKAKEIVPEYTKMVTSFGDLLGQAKMLSREEIKERVDNIESQYNTLLNSENK